MNRVFKNINIFLGQKYIFLRKDSKMEHISLEFMIFSKNYLKFFQFYETFKSRGIFGKFSYLVEKFPVAPTGIFQGERSGHLKTIKRPPQRVRGAKAPRTVAKVHFLKRFKYFEMNSFFKNVNRLSTIFLAKRSIFSKKNLGKLNIFYKNF